MREMTATIDRRRLVSVFTFVALSLATMILSGCNTTAGLGEDIESAGGALEDSAEDASD
jgi:predicted small secreted protein